MEDNTKINYEGASGLIKSVRNNGEVGSEAMQG